MNEKAPLDPELARELAEEGARALAEDQVITALDALSLEPQQTIRFTPAVLHRIVRPLAKGSFVVVAANTGIGKTPFLLSTVDDLVQAGHKVAYMGLEQKPHELRIAHACLRAEVPRAVAVENSWREHPDGDAMLQRVKRELRDQAIGALKDKLLFLPHETVSEKTLRDAAALAGDWGADVFVVDHINHQDGDGSYAEFRRLCQLSKKIAERHAFVNISAAQINREALRGGHRLTRYQPMQLHQIQGGGPIEQNAVLVLNLYRPIIKAPPKSRDEALVKQAMQGAIEPTLVLRPNRLGVVVLKHRVRGELEGQRCILEYDTGRFVDPPEEEWL